MSKKPVRDSMNDINSLQIRLMTAEDKPLAEEFFAQMSDISAGFFNMQRGNELRTYDFCDGRLSDHEFWIASGREENGREFIAGIVFVWERESMLPWLGVAVAERLQGRHLGERLVRTVIDWCLGTGRGGILLTTHKNNIRGQKLYERCGFERHGVWHNDEFLYILRFKCETKIKYS
jgi:RimJ/RimL family protein N-acetyltransferase